MTIKDISQNHRPDPRSSFPRGGANAGAGSFVTLDPTRDIDLHAPPTPNSPEVSLNGAPPHTKAPLAPSSESICGPPYLATADDVAREIDRAWGGLHRTRAMLMYLNIMNRKKPEMGQYLEDAQHAYVQSLCRYEVLDFEGAREFASASTNLVRVVEILVSNCILEASSLAAAGQ